MVRRMQQGEVWRRSVCSREGRGDVVRAAARGVVTWRVQLRGVQRAGAPTLEKQKHNKVSW